MSEPVDRHSKLQQAQFQAENQAHKADHGHEVEGKVLPHDEAHAKGAAQHADHYHFDSKTGQWIPHEKFHHGKGPEAWLARMVGRFLARLKTPGEMSKGEGRQTADSRSFREGSETKKVRGGSEQEGAERLKQQLLEKVPATELHFEKPPELTGEEKGRLEKLFTLFEKAFFGRFGEGKKLGQELAPGETKFRAKKEGEWVAFFQKFLPFTLERKVRPGDLQAMIFRGLVTTPAEMTVRTARAQQQAERATLVSDLRFVTGQTEKFVRVPLQGENAPLAQILATLSALAPGEVLNQAVLTQWFGGVEFPYLALSHKVTQPDQAQATNPLLEAAAARAEGGFAREAQQGIALSARTEELIARQLDINIRPIGQRSPSDPQWGGIVSPKKGGLFAFWRRRKGEEDEAILLPGFVPWYQLVFRPKKWKGKPKWWVPLLYFTAASAFGLFVVYVFKFLLQR